MYFLIDKMKLEKLQFIIPTYVNYKSERSQQFKFSLLQKLTFTAKQAFNFKTLLNFLFKEKLRLFVNLNSL